MMQINMAFTKIMLNRHKASFRSRKFETNKTKYTKGTIHIKFKMSISLSVVEGSGSQEDSTLFVMVYTVILIVVKHI